MFNKLKELVNSILDIEVKKENISKMIVTEIPLSNFENLYNSTSVNIIISPINEDSDTKPVMKLTCSEDYLKLINIESKNDLKISYHNNSVIITNGKKKPTLEVPSNFIENIYNKSLGDITVNSGVTVGNAINNESSGDIFVSNFIGNKVLNTGLGKISIDVLTSEYAHIESKSSGNIIVNDANINELDCRLHGLGDIKISGKVVEAHIKSTSSGDMIVENIQSSAKVDLSGLGNITITGTIFDKLSITSKSSGTVEVDGLNTEELTVSTSGLGDVKIGQGGAAQVKMVCSGSGNIECPELICLNSHLTLTSLGDIILVPSKTLEAYSKGSGNIKLNGNAVLDIAEVHISSLGEVKTDNVEAIELIMLGDKDSCHIKQNADYNSLHKRRMK